jgi:error-prone DNA polymerase
VEETLHDDLLTRPCVVAAFVSNAEPHQQALAAASASTRTSPLFPMTLPERVRADYETMNLTTGPHPMKLLREKLPNIWRATDLVHAQHGSTIQIAGNVICRQRPGTAKGFVFISLEDETGVSNAIVHPDLFEQFRLVITEEAFLLIEGQVQNSDGVVLIKARDIKPLIHERLVGSESHDFH